ncbi:MAG TPA: MMPL family transporter, partial [Candidatus Limnocylindria bacterium]|nr:MMPL family transporter [Candidatus Limnocylindria bacterium]
MLERWGRLVYRRRWILLLVSAVLLAASAVVALQGGDLQDPESLNASESGRASSLLNAQLPRATSAAVPVGTTFLLVFESDDRSVDEPRYREAVLDAVAPLRSDPRVQSMRTYYDAPAQSASLVSRDGRRTVVSVTLRDFRAVADHYYDDLRGEIHSDTLRIYATSNLPINHDLNRILDADLRRAEVVALPIALVLLLLVFGTLVGALLPLGVGLLAIVAGIAGVFLLSRVMDVSPYSLNIVTLIGLGTAIDYSLFVVARFREELRHGDVEDALARTMGTAGRAIIFSGLTVAIGLSGMLFFAGTFVSSLGVAGSIVVAFAVLYAVTFLPALLAILGRRVNALRIPVRRSASVGRGFWHAVATTVMRRPLLVLLPTVAVVLLAGSPFLEFRLATADTRALPPQAESRRGYDLLVANFPGQEQSTVTVVVHWPDGDPRSADATAYVTRVSDVYRRLPNVIRVNPPTFGGHIAVLGVVSSVPASTDEARELVRTIRGRSTTVPTMPGPPAGGELLVTGATAFDLDTIDFVAERAVWAVAFIVVLTYLALFGLLGSVVLPLKAVLMNLLSIAASFGALVWIFEQGHFAEQLNFTPQS